ncbi:hypothetical protein [Streptomyces sp. NBC_01497]|uniref:hypothetical protein n=1 Tax=Streptomyces sp. NBC_01497 TaxID=2903885 RepID=UPI002E306070|nr:hypothetical protein [Streptomyces sp. NBC_01497]
MTKILRALGLALLAALPLVAAGPAPAATARHPAPHPAAAVRPVAPVPVGTRVHLIDPAEDSGVHIAVHLNRDYVLLGERRGDRGDRVVFHRRGHGYTIEQTFSHYVHHSWWHAAGANGVRLSKESDATVFAVFPTRYGLLFADEQGRYPAIHHNGTRWLRTASRLDSRSSWAYFRTER